MYNVTWKNSTGLYFLCIREILWDSITWPQPKDFVLFRENDLTQEEIGQLNGGN